MAYRLHFASSCSDSVLAIDLYVIVCISVLYMEQVIMVAIMLYVVLRQGWNEFTHDLWTS